MKILAFDTSNTALSVAITDNDKVLAEHFSNENKTHSVTLFPAIQEVLKSANLSINEIDEIVVADGPGSFTGIRIAVTTAKTLAFTGKKDLKGVSSLAVIAKNIEDTDKLIVPYFDARRSNVFAGIYEYKDGKLVTVIPDNHFSIDDLLLELKKLNKSVIFVGTKIDELIEKSVEIDANFSEDFNPKARNLALLSKDVEVVKDIDSFIPRYLRYTKAEYDWLKENEEKKENNDYVQRV